MGTRLPIFPLGTVLVPGLVLPLHVFEPRYRILVEALMALPEGATRQFGVVALRSGSEVGAGRAPDLHAVGCTAELRDVTSRPNGTFDIVGVGDARFRLTGLDAEAGTPYHTGIVEFLPEPDGEGDLDRLLNRVIALFADYRAAVGVQVTPLPEDPQVISYLVAAAAVLHVSDRQRLLETDTTADRLRAEEELLRRECALIKTFHALPAVELTRVDASEN